MLTNVQETSIRAYHSLNPEVVKSTTALIELYIWANPGCSRRECAARLHLETAVVSARVNELIEAKRVVATTELTTCKVSKRRVQALFAIRKQLS
jgi:hypothetical protein